MKFKITSKNDQGCLVIHYFDNISLDITTEEGIPVVLANDPRCTQLLSFHHKYTPLKGLVKKREDIKTLRFTLGFNCNFHCRYCVEHLNRKDAGKQIKIHEDVASKALAIAERIDKNFPNLEKLVFWGGEPFVYYKAMRVVTKYFKEHRPKVNISTITNGSLLTLEVAKWIVENDINISISHDGPSFHIYRDDDDPLDNPKVIEAIQFLIKNHKQQLGFNGVITPENADLQKIPTWLQAKVGEELPQISFEGIARLDKYTQGIITSFDAESTKVVLNNLVAYGSTPDRNHAFGPLRDRVSDVASRIVKRITLPDIHCMIASDFFAACNMNGEILTCHGSPESYCTIETLDDVEFPTSARSWKDKHSTECEKCPLLVSCGGGCPLIDDEDQVAQCKNLKIWGAGLFIAAWKLLFNTTICRIEPAQENE